ncbi:YicC/YloC family endoribonuclease [Gracilibacillus kekensis]|uniref:TIGR00255 family protein n=1 Tax=Gracilibacillus kekensis TaxID=1027249 RepID=A0A1M7PER0_9BACI|nr:YicC/YloC family endoribonuclease [Gracilibacillus kekensis]SHN15499.1 TIGR00255 family protein [Gracilibacillus kekensis]
MLSMTGYGREDVQQEDLDISVEIKTINHRYLDITLHLPKALLHIEDQLKRIIQKKMKRGKITVSIYTFGQQINQKQLQTDWDLAEQYIDQLNQLKSTYQLSGDITMELLGKFPDIFYIKEHEETDSIIEKYITSALQKAVEKANQMRLNEGAELKKDLTERSKKIQNKIKQLGERRNIVIIEYQERILERINKYLENTSIYDESRLYQEIALLAEKGDISEELTRLHSHIKQFHHIIEESQPIGRKLDFIVQEINRELNTIGSKSNDTWISEQIVYLKSEAEKMKEQIQNLE